MFIVECVRLYDKTRWRDDFQFDTLAEARRCFDAVKKCKGIVRLKLRSSGHDVFDEFLGVRHEVH